MFKVVTRQSSFRLLSRVLSSTDALKRPQQCLGRHVHCDLGPMRPWIKGELQSVTSAPPPVLK